MIVYASIGNSDDHLSQADWHAFAAEFVATIRAATRQIHGEWYSASAAPYQNACVCFEVTADTAVPLQEDLMALGRRYGQDAIAWARASGTKFL